MKKCAGLGPHILEGENGGVQGPALVVRKRMTKSIRVSAVNRRASEGHLQETGTRKVRGGRELGR